MKSNLESNKNSVSALAFLITISGISATSASATNLDPMAQGDWFQISSSGVIAKVENDPMANSARSSADVFTPETAPFAAGNYVSSVSAIYRANNGKLYIAGCRGSASSRSGESYATGHQKR